jgi:hypothetical protein
MIYGWSVIPAVVYSIIWTVVILWVYAIRCFLDGTSRAEEAFKIDRLKKLAVFTVFFVICYISVVMMPILNMEALIMFRLAGFIMILLLNVSWLSSKIDVMRYRNQDSTNDHLFTMLYRRRWGKICSYIKEEKYRFVTDIAFFVISWGVVLRVLIGFWKIEGITCYDLNSGKNYTCGVGYSINVDEDPAPTVSLSLSLSLSLLTHPHTHTHTNRK